ncbi:MAG: prolipoprotein diacylglyceryl transferase [Clostridium sp.]|nr:prolipoprotein diacylglyceryl transferase [Clostridium sp.]
MNNPVAFELFGLEIRWYGILIAIGVVFALTIAYYNCKKLKLDFDILTDGFLWTFPFAIIGARFYYVIFQFEDYKDNLADIINIRQGGLAIHGGLIASLIVVIIFTKIKKVSIGKYLDVAAPSIIFAQAIGRWGNFMNSEAHGRAVTEEFISHFPKFIQDGMYIRGTYYHPTFLYESLWNLLVFVILLFLLYKKNNKQDGYIICSYIILYSLGRYFIEQLRTDSLMFHGFRVAQLVSISGVICGIVIILILKIRRQNEKA